MLSELARDTAAVFALFWNLCRSWLPEEIIRDIDNFVATHGLPGMDPGAIAPAPEGAYSITIEDATFAFHDVQLAPPMGMMASNYAR